MTNIIDAKNAFLKILNYFIPTDKSVRTKFYETISHENILRLLIISSFYFLFELKVMINITEVRTGVISGIPFNMISLNALVIITSMFLLKSKRKINGRLSHALISIYCFALLFWSVNVSLGQIIKSGSITMFILTLTATSAMFYRRILISLLTNASLYLYFVSHLHDMTKTGAMGQPMSANIIRRTNLYITDGFLIMAICCVLAAIIFRLRLKVFLEHKALKEQAIRDSMTNLMNHKTICDSLESEVKQSQRYSHPLSILMIDIDHFKAINDTYGHQFGDIVIKQISELLVSNCRETDFIGRYGGEEFLVILTNTGSEEAWTLGERLRKCIEETDFGISRAITVSCGLKSFDTGTENKTEASDEMIRIADQALYKAKEQGRNCIVKI